MKNEKRMRVPEDIYGEFTRPEVVKKPIQRKVVFDANMDHIYTKTGMKTFGIYTDGE